MFWQTLRHYPQRRQHPECQPRILGCRYANRFRRRVEIFHISDNGKQLQVNGNLNGNRVVDLLAPQVVVGKSANVNAADAINVSSGKSNFDYKTAQIEALDAASNAPVLDGHIFGSMRAGTIRIHATDKRAKQNIQNAAITGTRYLNIDSKGNLSIQSANLTGAQMELFARDTDIKGTVTSHSANKSSSGKERKMFSTSVRTATKRKPLPPAISMHPSH